MLDFAKIRRDLFPAISKKDNFQLEERKSQAKQYISDLMQLTEKENEYMDRFMAKEYRPELLFDDEEIVARICEHGLMLMRRDMSILMMYLTQISKALPSVTMKI